MSSLSNIKGPVAIIHCGRSATLGYWFNRFLSDNRAKFFDLSKSRNLDELVNYRSIIIVRYLHLLDISYLRKLKSNGCSILLFIDDDLLTFNFFSDLPFIYKLSIWWKTVRFKRSLNSFLSCILVTNSNLALITAKSLRNDISIKIVSSLISSPVRATKKIYRISYFGSSSHVLELKWLYNLFSQFQSIRDDCIIEIIANNYWRNIFRSIPRMKIIYPIPWDSFFLDSSFSNVDVVLVPVLPSRFNKCRSYTKFFDITRMNSVGIYSNNAPYVDFIRDNIDGCILPNIHELWINKINYLLANDSFRRNLLINSKKRVKDFSV